LADVLAQHVQCAETPSLTGKRDDAQGTKAFADHQPFPRELRLFFEILTPKCLLILEYPAGGTVLGIQRGTNQEPRFVFDLQGKDTQKVRLRFVDVYRRLIERKDWH
jgi:hypothetical protein